MNGITIIGALFGTAVFLWFLNTILKLILRLWLGPEIETPAQAH